jgi:hypothetical protein
MGLAGTKLAGVEFVGFDNHEGLKAIREVPRRRGAAMLRGFPAQRFGKKRHAIEASTHRMQHRLCDGRSDRGTHNLSNPCGGRRIGGTARPAG